MGLTGARLCAAIATPHLKLPISQPCHVAVAHAGPLSPLQTQCGETLCTGKNTAYGGDHASQSVVHDLHGLAWCVVTSSRRRDGAGVRCRKNPAPRAADRVASAAAAGTEGRDFSDPKKGEQGGS